MPTTNNETPTPKTLREKTQSFRNKARRILRMELINSVLQDIFSTNQELSRTTKELENLTTEETNAEKFVARAEYKMSKLDENDPDFEDKKTEATKFIETETVRQKSTLESIDRDIKYTKETIKNITEGIEKLDKKIEKIESGEIKVSIDELNVLAESLINKS